MNKDFFIKQLENILSEFETLSKNTQYEDFSDLSSEKISALITKFKAAVERIATKNSEYYRDVDKVYELPHLSSGNKLRRIKGSVFALYEDLKNDYLKSFSELLHSEIFSDYIEMAEHLLGEGYKDAAAVIAGSTLEEHLRKLCFKNSINIKYTSSNGKIKNIRAEAMNVELYKINCYSSGLQKQIVAWQDLRNNAAHGDYKLYTNEEVNLMIKGIQNFIINYPA